jgi:hypothetical protein
MGDEADLFFEAARAAAPVPSQALVARVLADAAAAQPRVAAARARGGLFARISDALGGRGVMAGLAGTAMAGLALGFFAPALAPDWNTPWSAGTVELIPDPDALLSAIEGTG